MHLGFHFIFLIRYSGSIQSDHEGQYIQMQGKVAPNVKDCLIKEFKIPSKYINVKKWISFILLFNSVSYY